MQKAIVSEISEEFLKCDTGFSDRFVYSKYFIPLSIVFEDKKIPIIPDYKKAFISRLFRYQILDIKNLTSVTPDYNIDELFKKNEFLPIEAPSHLFNSDFKGEDFEMNINDIKDLIDLLTKKLPDSDRGMISVMEKKFKNLREVFNRTKSNIGLHEDTTMVKSIRQLHKGYQQTSPALQREQEIDFFLRMLKSDFGYVFLDRTRIRPVGFCIGEHVYSLSLAPGEEVVLEQKTFSKRQTTLEVQDEQERQFDLELSSTLSTEIQEGLERQKNLTDSSGLIETFNVGLQSPELKFVKFNTDFTTQSVNNVTEAHQETMRRSTKDSQAASSKVASKYRTLHKTSFKISTEESYESSSKRVIKNPNKYTPIQLHYFKILRKDLMMQERCGMRLCWAPSIKDPASNFFKQIIDGKKAIIDKANGELLKEPPKPQPPSTDAAIKVIDWNDSETKEAKSWLPFGAMSADYDIDIPCEEGFTWDGDIEVVKDSIRLDHPTGRENDGWAGLVGTPAMKGNVLRVKIHVGASEVPPWRPDITARAESFYVTVGARFYKFQTNPDDTKDEVYQQQLLSYDKEMLEWRNEVEQIKEQAKKDAATWELEVTNNLNPITEILSQIIIKLFPSSIRNEFWEIELWQKMFEWNQASYEVYPSWWSDSPMRDPTKEPTHFFNASWAKLYLPVRVGMERIALRWIFGKVVDKKLANEIESQFDKIEEDLKNYRKEKFGDESEMMNLDETCQDFKEKFICLSKWFELIPTDGTHIEVIQSATTTVDDQTAMDLKDTSDLRASVLERENKNTEIKKKALDMMNQSANIQIHIHMDEPREQQP